MRQIQQWWRFAIFAVALMAMVSFAACSGNSPSTSEIRVSQSSQHLNGCDLGSVCTYPSFCWYDQTTNTGKLDCRQDTHTLGTSCMPGNYCDAQVLPTCLMGNGTTLVCDVVNHKINVSAPDAGAGGAGGAATTTTSTSSGTGGGATTTSSTSTTSGTGGAGGAVTTTTSTSSGTGGSGGTTTTTTSTTNSCPAPKQDVACVVDNYGCLPANVAFCLDGGNDAGIETMLQCLCPNPADGNRGTWLYSGTKCPAANLCWQPPAPDAGAGGAGGATTTTTTTTSTTTTGTGGAGGATTTSTTTTTSSSNGDAGVSDAGDAGQSDGGLPVGFMAFWVPPAGYVQNGAVTIEGWYTDSLGVNHGWAKLCDMALNAGVYSCKLSVPSGSDLYLDIKLNNALSDVGYCWVFDLSSFVPCGGKGVAVGTPTFAFNGAPIAFTKVPNDGDPKNTLFDNAHISPTP